MFQITILSAPAVFAAAWLGVVPVWANEESLEEIGRRMQVSAAEVEPLVFDRQIDLHAPGAAVTEYAVVFSRPLANPEREEDEGGGLFGWLGSDEANAGDAWLRKMDEHFRALIEEHAGPDAPAPTTQYNTEETDHRADLRRDGFAGLARRRTIAEGDPLWAALYARERTPESARLGTATARLIVRFEPAVDDDGRRVWLGAKTQAVIKPEDAPEGVDGEAWQKARAEHLKSLKEEAEVLAGRLNARPVTVPAYAAYSFQAGGAFRMTVDAEHRGETRQIRLTLEGTVIEAEDGARDALERLRTEWMVRFEDPEQGELRGFAKLSNRGYSGRGILLDLGERALKLGGLHSLSLEGGTLSGSYDYYGCPDLAIPICSIELKVSPNGQAMRGYWFDKEGERGGRMEWQKLTPEIHDAKMEPSSFKYAELPHNARSRGNYASGYVEIEGSSLPPDWPPTAGKHDYGEGLGSVSYVTEEEFYFHDSFLIEDGIAGNYRGDRIRVHFDMRPGIKPGTKQATLYGVPIEFELIIEDHPAAQPVLRELAFVEAGGDAGGDTEQAGLPALAPLSGGAEAIHIDGAYVLEARYDSGSGDQVKYPALRIERDGQIVYYFPKPHRRMTQEVPDGRFRTARLPLADILADAPEAEADTWFDATLGKVFRRVPQEGGAYAFQPGDLITAELDGVAQRWPLLSNSKGIPVSTKR